MNKVFLIGNLTHDPELTQTPSGVDVCHFSIAVNRNYRQGDGEVLTDFFNCTAWRGLAENVSKYLKKGNKVAVEGAVQIRTYEDNQGVKKIAVDIICNNVEFLTPKTDESDKYEEYIPPSKREETKERKRPVLQPFDDDEDSPF